MSSSAAIRAGRAFVELFTKDDELRKGLKAARMRLDNFAKGVNALSNNLLALGSAAAVPFGFAIKAAADLETVMTKFNVVFGESAKAVKAWGDAFAEEMGRSERQIAEFLAGTQDLLVPLGFDPRKAEQMSKDITRLAIDLAAFNKGVSDTDALRDLHAALTGSGEVMKKYGVIVSEAAVKQELLNQKIDPKNATELQKVWARLNIIVSGSTAAQGEAARAADTLEGQQKSLAAAVEKTAAIIGKTLLPVLQPLLKDVIEGAKEFAEWAEANEEFVVKAAKLAAGLFGLGVALKPIPPLIQLVTLAMKAATAVNPWMLLAGAIALVAMRLAEAKDAAEAFRAVFPDDVSGFFQTPEFKDMIAQTRERHPEWFRDGRGAPQSSSSPAPTPSPAATPTNAADNGASLDPTAAERWNLSNALDRPADKLDEAAKAELEAAFRLMEAGKAIQATLDYEQQQRFERMQVQADLAEWFAEQDAAFEDWQNEQQRLLERMPETLEQGSEAAAKAYLDANRGANPVLDVARQQVQAIHEVRELLRRANELQEKMQQRGLRVEGFALGR